MPTRSRHRSSDQDPVSITAENVSEVIDDGGASAEDVCAGFETQCEEAGIS